MPVESPSSLGFIKLLFDVLISWYEGGVTIFNSPKQAAVAGVPIMLLFWAAYVLDSRTIEKFATPLVLTLHGVS